MLAQSASQSCSNRNNFLTKPAYAEKYRAALYKSYEGGAVLFNSETIESLGGISFIESSLQQPDTEYRLEKVFNSRTGSGRSYFKYQEYYKGLEVEGRGYTLIVDEGNGPSDVYLRATGPGPGPGPGPQPCAQVIGISPNTLLVDGISINSKFSKIQVESDLKASNSTIEISKTELIVITEKDATCTPKLMYRTFYSEGTNKVAYINAKSGIIERTAVVDAHLDAPTNDYGIRVILDDTDNGNGAQWLVSSDGRVRTHDFGSSNILELSPADYNDNLIPTTTNANWFGTPRQLIVFQSHLVVTEALPAFDNVGVEFGEVLVGASISENANALLESRIEKAFVNFGILSGAPTALRDVAGHELGHCIINEFFPITSSLSSATLHEGVADMFGAYTESFTSPNGLDWVVGDDNSFVQNNIDRNAEFPREACFDDVEEQDISFLRRDPYYRASPLTHWFFNIVEGDAANGILAFGIEPSINLVLNALAVIESDQNGEFGYEQFRDATLMALDMQFGLCSPEYQSVALAWDDICIDTQDCEFSFTGPNGFCDSDRSAVFCVVNGAVGAHYRWTFPIEWTVTGGQGNSYEGGCLQVTNIPSYSSYPKTVNVSVSTVPFGSNYNRSRQITISNCTGGGGCATAPKDDVKGDKLFNNVGINKDSHVLTGERVHYILYGLSGQEIRRGSYNAGDLRIIQSANIPSGLYLIAKFDTQNVYLETQKIVIR